MTSPRLRLISNPALNEQRTPIDGLFGGPAPERVAEALRRGICPNERAFDRFLAYELRIVSCQYWTPLAVVLRVAEWLNASAVRTVVDIGSGAGKFCVATALATRCEFIGVEQRPRLVEAARELAELFGVADRVRFVHSAMSPDALPRADAYYLYNPFGENLFGSEDHLDNDVELSKERYARDVAATERLLEQAPIGTYLIKYNGFGGRVPQTYDMLNNDIQLPNMLRMWRKVRPNWAE